jgi:hypothetical protein
LPALRETLSRAFASCSRWPGTICGAVDRVEKRQLPDLGDPGQQQHRHRRRRGGAGEVGAQHRHPRRDPIGDHSPGQDQRGDDDAVGGEDDAEVGSRPGQVEDRESERDRRHPVADQRGGAAEE